MERNQKNPFRWSLKLKYSHLQSQPMCHILNIFHDHLYYQSQIIDVEARLPLNMLSFSSQIHESYSNHNVVLFERIVKSLFSTTSANVFSISDKYLGPCHLQKQPPEMFCEKVVPRNFTKFTGKHLCQSLFFNKVAKKETLAQVISCEFCEISKNTLFQRTHVVAASTFICNEISQNSQGNTCTKVSFLIMLQASVDNFIEKETLVQVFSYEFCETSRSTSSYRTPLVAASAFICNEAFQQKQLTILPKKIHHKCFAVP